MIFNQAFNYRKSIPSFCSIGLISMLCPGMIGYASAGAVAETNRIATSDGSLAVEVGKQLGVQTNAIVSEFRVKTGDQLLLESPLAGGWSPISLSDKSQLLGEIGETITGPTWRVLSVNYKHDGGSQFLTRHFLVVDPNIVVVADEYFFTGINRFGGSWLTSMAGKWDDSWKRYDLSNDARRVLVQNLGSVVMNGRSLERVATIGDSTSSALWRLGIQTDPVKGEFCCATAVLVSPLTKPISYACKWLDSGSAFGLRIHRDGYPTLIAFRKSGARGSVSLAGFSFDGPVGVSVFAPRHRSR